ncbi:hypothetical protein PBCVNY2B_298R [Paramecium bursaria Chlorella virus NY2B]|uniref:Uncharacterized protein n=1 Tax=Paramecium bursaria Chlorella virus NYs1 TaxID=83442 RepID=M1IJK6_9PHYC|nr:hypothetical protein AR158_C244R [Paramecium bursaria Chlorella virus AR158]YP_009665310.1 hypothetical protein FK949_gp100 [Paramecium bursaria Chlorella virus NYs1]AGE54169.1 hypothetical protein PBCVIL52s1_287R [Paramecium bursaria Chlorella virus IL-5-2s1]AGE54814.1 hypothetical protein PBCVMA1D_171R [Paramecium bursaria Chlorella virus MA1D]AGE58291.1 hypothetical protein PBCVNY2B_298R [Paramecium bursaria Chlorella virus NY2B]ABU43789.1 hypothetical protein AR158_C244R [Paramecium bur
MNKYLEIFFWIVAIYLISMSIVHLVNVLKSRKDDDNNTKLIKAVVYVAGGITLILLLLHKPFSINKITKILKHKPSVMTAETVMISTSMAGPGTSIGTSV